MRKSWGAELSLATAIEFNDLAVEHRRPGTELSGNAFRGAARGSQVTQALGLNRIYFAALSSPESPPVGCLSQSPEAAMQDVTAH
jgi:hypothetical protein